ncbi:heterokaryon incompatibility protein-domain-containing protein [Podospora conica]|nr:heterokaryon incompatibility protein-domain-containing protein [Schizothecium conicum]
MQFLVSLLAATFIGVAMAGPLDTRGGRPCGFSNPDDYEACPPEALNVLQPLTPTSEGRHAPPRFPALNTAVRYRSLGSSIMWLLDVDDYTLRQFINPQDVHLGGYAILSHTWGDGEVSFDDIQCLDVARARPAWDKVQQTCRVAEERGFAFVWIDTCCIDKRSSAELSEAINSMFAWYRAAAECYVYLADLGGDDGNQFYLYGDENKPFPDIRKCRWFTRGWTLQELIAPKFMYFYDRTWTQRGSKKSLSELLTRITNIDKETLFDPERLYSLPVARRMSWAATRQTTRPEDMSYCLFGIFGVNMPLLYGEGANAFLRLQEAIALTTEDLSLFAWDDPAGSVAPPYSGILAHSPAQFRHCHRLHNIEDPLQSGFRPFSMVNHCFSFQTSLLTDTENGQYLMPLHCRKNPEDFHSSFTIALELIKTATGFVRHERTIIPSNFNITHPTSWDPVPRTVTIPKVLRETDLLRIRHQSDNAFNFMVSISGEWAHKLSATVPDLSEEAPSGTGWDSSTGRYLTNNSPLFTGLLTGTIYENRAFFSEKYAQFLLFFGFAGGYTKDLGLFSGPDREYIQEPWIALSRSDGNSPIETFNPKSTHVFDLPGNVLAQQHRMHYLRFTSYAGHFYRQELKLTQEEDWSNAGERTRLAT